MNLLEIGVAQGFKQELIEVRDAIQHIKAGEFSVYINSHGKMPAKVQEAVRVRLLECYLAMEQLVLIQLKELGVEE